MRRFSCLAKTAWSGGRSGSGTAEAPHLNVALSVPSELGGNGAGTNPEELLIAAAASCYALTFGSLAERQGLPVSQVRVSCEGAFEFEAGLQLASLAYRVVARMRAGVSEEEIAKAQRALERCEQLCMVATALRGNVRSHLDLVVEREGSS